MENLLFLGVPILKHITVCHLGYISINFPPFQYSFDKKENELYTFEQGRTR